jgi:hypothetical protein
MRKCDPALLSVSKQATMLLASMRRMRGIVMFWSTIAQLVAPLLDVLTARRQAEDAKDLEIVVLRHQLRVPERRQPRPRLTRWERLTLALLVTKLRRVTAGARALVPERGAGHAGDRAALASRPGAAHMDLPG